MEQFWSRPVENLKPYYQTRGITLYHGDSRKILPELEAESFDIVLTDPPYLVSYTGRWGSEYEPIKGDADSSWVLPIYSEIYRVLKADALCLTFYGWPHAETFLGAWRHVGFRAVSIFALVKDRFGLGYYTRAQHEPAYLLAKGKPRKPEPAISDVLDWKITPPLLHPNQKPLPAITRLLGTFTDNNSSVLDPFSGSGTTLLAAQRLGLNAIGIEIDERFCEVAATRLSQQVLDYDWRALILTEQGDQP
jgi:DNA modification methylase